MHAHCLIHARIKMRFHMARREAKEKLHNAFFKCADFKTKVVCRLLSQQKTTLETYVKTATPNASVLVYMQCVDHEYAHTARTRAHTHMLCAHLHTTQPTKDPTISAAKIVQSQYRTRLSNCSANKQCGLENATKKKLNLRLRNESVGQIFLNNTAKAWRLFSREDLAMRSLLTASSSSALIRLICSFCPVVPPVVDFPSLTAAVGTTACMR